MIESPVCNSSLEDRNHPLVFDKEGHLDGISILRRGRVSSLPFGIKCASESQLIEMGKSLLRGESIRSVSRRTGINCWSIQRFVKLSKLPSATVKRWSRPGVNAGLSNVRRHETAIAKRQQRQEEKIALRALKLWVRSWKPIERKRVLKAKHARLEEKFATARRCEVFSSFLSGCQSLYHEEIATIQLKRSERRARRLRKEVKYPAIYEMLETGKSRAIIRLSDMDCDIDTYYKRAASIVRLAGKYWHWSVQKRGTYIVITRLHRWGSQCAQ